MGHVTLESRLDAGGMGLVVQGGGMRGTYSVAVLAALEDLGYTNAFSKIYGSSAGALNGAYFLARQANSAVRVYIDHLSNKRFVNPLRVWRIMDIDYLVDVVLTHKVPLDVEALRASETELNILLTNANDGRTVTVTNHGQDPPLMEALRATAALPIIFGREIRLNGEPFVDGGLTSALPLDLALDDQDLSDILVVLTRPVDHRRTAPSRYLTPLVRGIAKLWGHSPGVVRNIGRADTDYNQNMDTLSGVSDVERPVRLWIVEPSDLSRLAKRTTNERDQLEATARMARRDLSSLLASPPDIHAPNTP